MLEQAGFELKCGVWWCPGPFGSPHAPPGGSSQCGGHLGGWGGPHPLVQPSKGVFARALHPITAAIAAATCHMCRCLHGRCRAHSLLLPHKPPATPPCCCRHCLCCSLPPLLHAAAACSLPRFDQNKHMVAGSNILLAKHTQTMINGFLRDVKRFRCFWRALKLARWWEWNIIRRKND